jgi:uncharacterized protein YbcI
MTQTDSKTSAAEVERIVNRFLIHHVGENPKEMKVEMTEDMIAVLIKSPIPPAERELLERYGTEAESFQRFREHLFRKSEHILRERLSDFLQRPITQFHYIFGPQADSMSIIMYLEPLPDKKGEMSNDRDDKNAM